MPPGKHIIYDILGDEFALQQGVKDVLLKAVMKLLYVNTATYGMWLFPSDTAKKVAAVINFFLAIPIAALTALDVARSVESDPEEPLLHEFSELRVIVGWIYIGIAAVITGWALFNIFVQERPGPHLFRAAIPRSLFLMGLLKNAAPRHF